MTVVKCKNCEWYEPIIHACGRIDSQAGAFVSYVTDECWCSVEEGAIPMTDEEFERRWWGVGEERA